MKLIYTLCTILLLVGCNKEETLSSRINRVIRNENISSGTIAEELKSRLGIVEDCVYLIYSFDSGCSSCLAEFYKIINETNCCEHDSMIVVANEAYDRLLIDFYAAETNTEIQERCRIVCDKNGSISRYIENNYGMNLLLTIGETILIVDDTHFYEYGENGFTRQ